MVTINNISYDCDCQLYFKNQLIGSFKNEAQLDNIRIQIRKENNITVPMSDSRNVIESGYHVLFQTQIIPIYTNGSIHNWVTGFFDSKDSIYKELIGF